MAYKANFWRKILRKLRLAVSQLSLTARKEQTVFSREVGKALKASGGSIITMTTL